MKVHIGNYVNHITPYTLVSPLEKIGIGEDRIDKIRDFLLPVLEPLCNLINRIKPKRKIKIHVDRWDAWDGGHTIAMIALPVIKEVLKRKQGAPCVEYTDVPEHLRPTAEDILKYSKFGETDDKFFERWDWVMSEIVYALEAVVDDDLESRFYIDGNFDQISYQIECERIEYGMLLFGKYFRSLWV